MLSHVGPLVFAVSAIPCLFYVVFKPGIVIVFEVLFLFEIIPILDVVYFWESQKKFNSHHPILNSPEEDHPNLPGIWLYIV